MRIALLHETAPSTAPGTVEAVGLALRDLGHGPVHVRVDGDPTGWAGQLAEASADLVLNLCGAAVPGRTARVAAVAELLGLPLAGSASDVLALLHRPRWRAALLTAAGLPIQRPPPPPRPPSAPPRRTRAVIQDGGGTGSRGRRTRDGSVLAVGLVAGTALPLPATGARRLDASGTHNAATLARRAWAAVGGRDYGVVWLEAGPGGGWRVRDVRPNPPLAPSAALARAATAGGWGYVDLIGRIVRAAAGAPGRRDQAGAGSESGSDSGAGPRSESRSDRSSEIRNGLTR